MVKPTNFAKTRQGVRDLDHPVRVRAGKVNVGNTERAVSGVGGAMLAGLGLVRGGLCGLALVALGGALVYRGSTGHCAMYTATGMNTAR